MSILQLTVHHSVTTADSPRRNAKGQGSSVKRAVKRKRNVLADSSYSDTDDDHTIKPPKKKTDRHTQKSATQTAGKGAVQSLAAVIDNHNQIRQDLTKATTRGAELTAELKAGRAAKREKDRELTKLRNMYKALKEDYSRLQKQMATMEGMMAQVVS